MGHRHSFGADHAVTGGEHRQPFTGKGIDGVELGHHKAATLAIRPFLAQPHLAHAAQRQDQIGQIIKCAAKERQAKGKRCAWRIAILPVRWRRQRVRPPHITGDRLIIFQRQQLADRAEGAVLRISPLRAPFRAEGTAQYTDKGPAQRAALEVMEEQRRGHLHRDTDVVRGERDGEGGGEQI